MGGDWLTVRVPTKPSAGASQPAPTQPVRSEPASPGPEAIDLTGLSYEQARDELVAVVARLEAGGASLEESLELWERGEALAARCQEWLDGARRRLESSRGDGSPTSTEDATDASTEAAAQPGGAR
jgi:exodeoxyribonuclease VII small subunit